MVLPGHPPTKNDMSCVVIGKDIQHILVSYEGVALRYLWPTLYWTYQWVTRYPVACSANDDYDDKSVKLVIQKHKGRIIDEYYDYGDTKKEKKIIIMNMILMVL